MGREANCICKWNNSKHEVKALIEPPELILRGGLKRKIPFVKMKNVVADGGMLRFTFDGETVALELGSALAERWAEALLKPPPTLARKLGICSEATVRMIGPVDDTNLKTALAEAKAVSQSKGDLILARVDTAAELRTVLAKTSDQLRAGTPIWFIYFKGPGHPLNENLVRETALRSGIVDTKIAAVSAEFSALRFVKRKS
ncbi:MAG TPA: hypothetical protein VKB47_08395 [Terracidiphilus sp.]|nr:hypothetical protein [Terracidiphilus sp.]